MGRAAAPWRHRRARPRPRSDGDQPDRTGPRTVRRRRLPRLRGSPDRRGLPDPAGPRRPRPRLRARRPGDHPRPERRLPAPPAADPVRRRLLDADPRLQGQCPADRPAGGRSGAVHDGRRRVGRRSPSSPGINVGAAFTLGAIVAPPDAVAATAIFRRLGVPRRIVTILEGESLINDATALIAYRFAVVLAIEGRLLVRRGRLRIRLRRRPSGS